MTVFDPETTDPLQLYRIFTSVLVPRPIGWVSTKDGKGVANLAPFSFFGGISAEPPMVYLSISRRGGQLKDTAANLLQWGEFVVHLVDRTLARPMVATSAEYPPEVDEFQAVGLTPVPGVKVAVPRVAEAPAALECRLVKHFEIGAGPCTVFIGEVVLIHLSPQLLTEGAEGSQVDVRTLDPLARLGLRGYATLAEPFELERPRP